MQRDRDRDDWRRRGDDDWRRNRSFGTDPDLRDRWGSEGQYETDGRYGYYDDRYSSASRHDDDRSDDDRMRGQGRDDQGRFDRDRYGQSRYGQDRFRQGQYDQDRYDQGRYGRGERLDEDYYRRLAYGDNRPGVRHSSDRGFGGRSGEDFGYGDRYEPRYPRTERSSQPGQRYERSGRYGDEGAPYWIYDTDYDEGRAYSGRGISTDRGDYGYGPPQYDQRPYDRRSYRRTDEDWRHEDYGRSQLGGTYGQGRAWQGHDQHPHHVDEDRSSFRGAGRGMEYRQYGGEYPVYRQSTYGQPRYGQATSERPDYGRWAYEEMWDYRHGRHTGRGPRGYQRSDDRIREDANETLTRHGDIDATDIDVDVRDGEVILKGTVDSGRTRRAAEEAVENLPGVRDVRNELRVDRSSQYGMSGTGRSGEGSRMGEQRGSFSSGPGDTRKVRVGMKVVGSDGDTVGHVKEVRERDFLVDRGAQRDVYVPFDAVLNAMPDEIMLRCSVDAVDDQGWASPDLTGTGSTTSNTSR